MKTEYIVMIVLGVTTLIGLIVNIVQFVVNRKKDKKVVETISAYLESGATNTEEEEIPTSSIPLAERISTTKALQDFIIQQIQLFIVVERRFEIFLDQKNKNLDTDKVIQAVANDVWKSLKLDSKVNEALIVDEDYLMKFIIHNTSILFLQYLNNNVADQI